MMNQALTVARSRTNASIIPRCLSSVTTAPTKSSTPSFVEQRRIYQAQLSELRKGWAAEIKVKRAETAVEAVAERKRVVLQKAVSLRQQRIDSIARQSKNKIRTELAHQKFREHVARSQVIREQRHTVQEARHSRLVQDLVEEKDQWITNDNLNFKVTDNLFEQPTTTGLVTRSSNLYRFQVIPMSMQRMMSNHGGSDSTENGLKERLEEKGQLATAKKLMVAEFLETMIGTGAERNKYEEYVESFSKMYDEEGVFDGENNELQDYIDENSRNRTGNKVSSFNGGKDRNENRNTRRTKDEAAEYRED
mmetsp:Transcript_34614/g.32975  ORF Transcript_34614/g.32975 Transcript_34614/m.32975 type:complete len:307 (-) Transcript_34614:113-1033(-)